MIIFNNTSLQRELSNSLLLFYIALTSNFLVNFYPKSHIDFVKNNIFVKHLLGFFTMLFSIYHITTITDVETILLITFLLYLWFLMSTRLHPMYNILIIVVLSILFLINIKVGQLKVKAYNKKDKEIVKTLSQLAMFIFSFLISFILIIFLSKYIR